MTDRLERLEAELSAMRPRPLSIELAERLDTTLATSPARPWGDRLLVFAMSMGAIAACVSAALLLKPSAPLPPSPALSIVRTAPQPPHDSPTVFARADARWLNLLKESNRSDL